MASEVAAREARLWPEQWAIDAAVKVETVRQQVRIAQSDLDAQKDPRRQAVAEAIDVLLGTARGAVERGRLPMRNPHDKWRGTSIVRAYQSLHAAEVFLIDLLPDRQVATLVPKVVAKLEAVLEAGDPRRELIERLSARATLRGPVPRAAVQQAMAIGYEAADQLHVRVRNFRNVLLSSAALITALMAVLVLLVIERPTAMPLCFTPSTTNSSTAEPATPGTTPPPSAVCPSGEGQSPAPEDIVIVTGLGLLGGALAAAFSIRGIRGTSVPYDIPIALALLKVPSGSLTALAGIILLGGAFVPGLSELDSQRQILAYALVLGYAQQLATRFIDNRAQTLLDSVPSKESTPTPPTPPVTPATPRTIRVVRRVSARRVRQSAPPRPRSRSQGTATAGGNPS